VIYSSTELAVIDYMLLFCLRLGINSPEERNRTQYTIFAFDGRENMAVNMKFKNGVSGPEAARIGQKNECALDKAEGFDFGLSPK
jgi:hypothetical protein